MGFDRLAAAACFLSTRWVPLEERASPCQARRTKPPENNEHSQGTYTKTEKHKTQKKKRKESMTKICGTVVVCWEAVSQRRGAAATHLPSAFHPSLSVLSVLFSFRPSAMLNAAVSPRRFRLRSRTDSETLRPSISPTVTLFTALGWS